MSTLARQRSPKCATAKTSHILQFQDQGQLGLEDLLIPGTLFARFDNRPKYRRKCVGSHGNYPSNTHKSSFENMACVVVQ